MITLQLKVYKNSLFPTYLSVSVVIHFLNDSHSDKGEMNFNLNLPNSIEVRQFEHPMHSNWQIMKLKLTSYCNHVRNPTDNEFGRDTLVITAPGRPKQEDYNRFRDNLSYMTSSMPAWATQ